MVFWEGLQRLPKTVRRIRLCSKFELQKNFLSMSLEEDFDETYLEELNILTTVLLTECKVWNLDMPKNVASNIAKFTIEQRNF